MLYLSGNSIGSRLEYDGLMGNTINDKNKMSIEVKSNNGNGIIAFAYQRNSTDTMAVYLREGKVIRKYILDYTYNI